MSQTARSSPHATVLARANAPEPGRLTTLAVLGGAAGAIPLPILPANLMRRIRGAVAHDVVARHGLSLTTDGRAAIAEPTTDARHRGAVGSAMVYVAKRIMSRVGVLGVLPPIAAWLEVYALGLLFERYLDRVRRRSSVRVDATEAGRVRLAIDQAVTRAFSRTTRPEPSAAAEAGEDLRDPTTRLLDSLLLGVSTVPSHVQRRLETAFDAVVAESEELRSG